MNRFSVLVAAGLLAPAHAQAIEPAAVGADTSFSSWHLDQDLFALGHNQDRNYTMGVRFVWQNDAARHKLAGKLLLPLVDGIDPSGAGAYAVSFGNSAFTPDDLRRSDVIADDRPYGSLLYWGASVVASDADAPERQASAAKLVVGVLGLPISDWGQSGIHTAWRHFAGTPDPYDPKGWDNQISDGGEFTAMYQRSWLQRLPVSSRYFDAAQTVDAYAGYYTGASYAVVGKWGRFSKETTPFWEMIGDIDPQADANMLAQLQTVPARSDQGAVYLGTVASTGLDPWYRIKEWYFTGGVRARWVGYNELLQGGFRDSRHTLSAGEIERWVGEASVGFNLTFPLGRRLMLTCTERSPEHKLAERRSHRWCGINFYRASRR
ncbi:lipid A deacylase LpxR family protein [Lysobacter solisilvae (ex Woo and Kim 2020)]|uniref:Lipid A deacylase LpxR family protein n=1 Tax=Agrilutibacter terrestris TaxID=2865112 RepID=A0A7H0FWU9_9GAMM|nr:lipid A deacylase LpxR family protein [Lysobacter terrestris]QNP40515.1 lipid A deacylase LpxR family protein [Lysobacter terrestris]